MGSAQDMVAYTERLQQHTPALDKPVTEIAVFTLKAPHTEATRAEFRNQIIDNCHGAKGIKRISWGFVLDDDRTLVWMLDWDRIQDHWEFWQSPRFEPGMTSITNLFEPRRPLVRHYNFRPAGMLHQKHQRIFIWDEVDGRPEENMLIYINPVGGGSWKASKGAYAVDLDESTWWCTVLGYESEEAARRDIFRSKGVAHILELTFH